MSHLRPGFDPAYLARPKSLSSPLSRGRMSQKLCHRVREAVAAGVQFQYHVGIEEHLAYARRWASAASGHVLL